MVCSHETPECRCAYYWRGFSAVYKPGLMCWDILLGTERVDSATTREEAIAVIRGGKE